MAKKASDNHTSSGQPVPVQTGSGAISDAPDALTLDEVLEQMLPLCDDDPFAVADWLEARVGKSRKSKGIRLLADGIPVPPHFCKTELAIVAKPAGDGIATLEVVSRGRTLTRVKGHYEVIIGSDESGEPIKQLRELTEPMRRWTIERKSFEDNRLDAPRNRGGRPDKYPHMRIVIEAMIYIAVNGPPATLDGEGGLFEKLGLRLKPAETPGPGTLYNIFNPIWKRIEDERKDIEDARKKFKNKKKSDQ